MKNKRNSKEIQRDHRIEIRVSKEEKELWNEYANKLGIAPTRLIRNIMMLEANKNALSKGVEIFFINKYKDYLKTTNQLDRIKEIETE